MGCLSSDTKKTKNKDYQDFSKVPQGTDNLIGKNLPERKFKGNLSNIKLKHVQYGSIGINFDIGNFEKVELEEKKVSSQKSIRWRNINKDFNFKINQLQLRNLSVNITVIEKGQQIGKLTINLYLVATGPYHHDFVIPLKGRSNARITFDLRISQIILVKAIPISTTLRLNHYQADIYTFTMKTIIGNSTWQSNASYIVRMTLEDQMETHRQSKFQAGKKLMRNLSIAEFQKVVKRGNEIVWNKDQSQQMPQFSAQFPFEQFSSATLQIVFWGLENVVKARQKIVGQSSYSFGKLVLGKQQLKTVNGISFEVYELNIEQLLEEGRCKLKMILQVQQHIKQISVCVRTEEGILSSPPIFTNNQAKNEELIELVRLHKQNQIEFEQLEKINVSSKSSKLQIRRVTQTILKNLEKKTQLLKRTVKQSSIIYSYSSESQLKKGIKIFLEISKRILVFINEQDEDIRKRCWQVLIALMKRSELTLTYMGFTHQQITFIKNGQKDSQINNKIKTGIIYQQFLYQLLQLALKSLVVKGFHQEQIFAQKFCAYAYFRIPQFRNQVLSAIILKGDPDISQLITNEQFVSPKNHDFSLMKDNGELFRSMFDWADKFHRCLEGQQKAIENKIKLNQLLVQEKWKERLSKRGGAYFQFVKNWVEYVEELTVKTKNLEWNYFPGYTKIINSYIIMLKNTPIESTSLQMRQAGCKLLANEKLLNVFITIIISKANANSNTQILKSLQLISIFFNSLKDSVLPSNFKYIAFQKAIKIILEGEFAFAIAKTLQLLYQSFEMFSIEFQTNISMYLLGKVFFKCFLHWSANVRLIFHHLIVMRIYNEAHIVQTAERATVGRLKLKYANQIKPRYQKLMLMLENAEKIKKNQNSKKISIFYDQQFYRKMKRKLNEKKNIPNPPLSYSRLNTEVYLRNQPVQTQKIPQMSKIKTEPDWKYSVEQLSKVKLERYNSEMIKINILDAIKNRKKDKQQQEERNRLQTNVYYNESEKKTRKLSVENFTDYQITSPSQPQINYLLMSMDQYVKINEIYVKILKNKAMKAPRVKLQLPVDQKEFKPEGIDEW